MLWLAGRMPIDLIAGTDAALCAVFDPASVGRLRVMSWDALNAGAIDKEAEAGRLVLLDTGADGRFKFRAYVDEAPPPELLARAFHVERGKLLRLPSGTLRSTGAEYLVGKANQPPPPDLFTDAKVPAGDYATDAFLIEPNAQDDRELTVDHVTGIGLFLSLMLVGVALLFLSTNDWEFQPASLAIVAVLAAFWLVVIGWHQLPATRAARRRLADEVTPSLVLVLTRLPDDVDRSRLKGVLLRPPAS